MKKPGTILSVIIGLIMITSVVAISFLITRDTQQRFSVSIGQALETSLQNKEVLSLQEFERIQHNKEVSYTLIDTRSKADFDKGHLDQAIHMYAPTLLKEESLDFFKSLSEAKKLAVLYAGTRGEAINTALLLKQMEIRNVKVLDTNYTSSKVNIAIGKKEAPPIDFSKFIKEENQKDLVRIKKEKEQKKRIVKRVIPKKKQVSVQRKSPPSAAPEEEEDEGC